MTPWSFIFATLAAQLAIIGAGAMWIASIMYRTHGFMEGEQPRFEGIYHRFGIVVDSSILFCITATGYFVGFFSKGLSVIPLVLIPFALFAGVMLVELRANRRVYWFRSALYR